MPDIKEIAKTTMGEIERLLNARTVVGDPIHVEGGTVIPLVSFGFGFGAGGGQGKNIAGLYSSAEPAERFAEP